MEKEKEKVNTSGQSSKSKKPTKPSGLITNPEKRPVLVAKVRDDLNVCRKAGFLVAMENEPLKASVGLDVNVVKITYAAPLGDTLKVNKEGQFVYNGKVIT